MISLLLFMFVFGFFWGLVGAEFQRWIKARRCDPRIDMMRSIERRRRALSTGFFGSK